jgi:hypothetical protein
MRAGIALIVATEVPLPPCTANLHVPHTRHILCILGVLLAVPSMHSMCRVCSWTVEFTGAVCARADPRCRFLYRTRPLGTLTRSVSEGVEPLRRLHLASVVPPSRKVAVPPGATLAATLSTNVIDCP